MISVHMSRSMSGVWDKIVLRFMRKKHFLLLFLLLQKYVSQKSSPVTTATLPFRSGIQASVILREVIVRS